MFIIARKHITPRRMLYRARIVLEACSYRNCNRPITQRRYIIYWKLAHQVSSFARVGSGHESVRQVLTRFWVLIGYALCSSALQIRFCFLLSKGVVVVQKFTAPPRNIIVNVERYGVATYNQNLLSLAARYVIDVKKRFTCFILVTFLRFLTFFYFPNVFYF